MRGSYPSSQDLESQLQQGQDRITSLLQRRAQAQEPELSERDIALSLVGSLANPAADFLSSLEVIRSQRALEQERGFEKELAAELSALDQVNQAIAAGDKRAERFMQTLKTFAGNDPDAMVS